jgi:hypothetical protein
MAEQPKQRVIACDLDGTLALYDQFKGPAIIDGPVPEMVQKVKAALAAGDEVWIFTARVNPKDESQQSYLDAMAAMDAISLFCYQQIGVNLPVTHEKLTRFTDFWDDRAKQVYPNTGLFVTDILDV